MRNPVRSRAVDLLYPDMRSHLDFKGCSWKPALTPHCNASFLYRGEIARLAKEIMGTRCGCPGR